MLYIFFAADAAAAATDDDSIPYLTVLNIQMGAIRLASQQIQQQQQKGKQAAR